MPTALTDFNQREATMNPTLTRTATTDLSNRGAPIAIEAVDLVKRFGDFTAVDRVGFRVRQGTVLGLLGPNGAGKTTVVRMMTTLSPPTSGTARVAGYDVSTEPDMVRRRGRGIPGHEHNPGDMHAVQRPIRGLRQPP